MRDTRTKKKESKNYFNLRLTDGESSALTPLLSARDT